MRNARQIRLGMVAAIVGITILLPSEARAGWHWSAQVYARDEKVCHDGMRVSIAYFGTKQQSEDVSPVGVTVSARLYAETALPTNDLEGQLFPFEYYGPLLTSEGLTMEYHDIPILDPAGIDGKFYTYSLNNDVPWTRRLATGTTVLMRGGGPPWSATIQDCDLNPATVAEGAALTLGDNFLKGDDGAIAPAHLKYRVGTVPANGSLRLNGAPLAAGDLFTQADVNQNRLSYLHNGSETTADSFSFSVAATTRISVATNGAQATGGASYRPAISGDARSIAFTSDATNLVSADTNDVADVFVRDRVASFCRPANTTTRVSIDASGTEGNAPSTTASLNEDGTTIAFESTATNLVAGDSNGQKDVFVYKRYFGAECVPTPQTVRASVHSSSAQADNASSSASISADPYDIQVAFQSLATNLVSGDTAGEQDVFVNSNSNFTYRLTGPSTLSVQGDGASDSSSISANGDSVAFRSDATNLVVGDTNAKGDIFLWQSYDIARVSASSTSGVEANDDSFTPRISAAGNAVAFQSRATNLVADDTSGGTAGADIFVYDRAIATTTRASISSLGVQADAASANPVTSAGGRYIAFQSIASNLVPGDTNSCRSLFFSVNCSDIFVHDRVRGTTQRISVDSIGAQANGHSYNASMSYDGSYVAFDSYATNLVSDDSNALRDVFLRYLGFSSSLPITVTAVNDAPVARANSYTVAEDTVLTIGAPGVLANDSDAEGTPLIAVLVGSPAHGTVTLNPNGSFTYRPAANFNGIDSLTYRASDGLRSSQIVAVTITVTAVNDAPVARANSYAVNEDTILKIVAPGVLGNDSDAEGATLTAVLVGSPAHGTVTLNPNGSFTYRPVADFNGADRFTYRASDGLRSSPIAKVSITVKAVDEKLFLPFVRR